MERKKQSRALAEKFVEYFIEDASTVTSSQGGVRGLKLDQDLGYDYDKLITSRNDEVARAPIYGYDANSMTLYLKYIPKNVSRSQLLEVIRSNTEGFVSLSMSEPLKTQGFERYAWISYDSDENCRKAKENLEQAVVTRENDESFRLSPNLNSAHRKNIMITPELPDDCIARDLDICQKLISEVFDPEKEIPTDLFGKIQSYG